MPAGNRRENRMEDKQYGSMDEIKVLGPDDLESVPGGIDLGMLTPEEKSHYAYVRNNNTNAVIAFGSGKISNEERLAAHTEYVTYLDYLKKKYEVKEGAKL